MKKPITLDGIKYFYEINTEVSDDGIYTVTELFKAPTKKEVTKKDSLSVVF